MEDKFLRIAVAQINCTVGDLEGNCAKIKEYILKSRQADCDIIVFPELVITGYPPEDLLIKPKFIQDNLTQLKELASFIKNEVVVVGFVDASTSLGINPEQTPCNRTGCVEGVDKQAVQLYNAAAVIYQGKVKGVYRKTHLPNYGVFDEKRYFTDGDRQKVFKLGEVIFGVNICEDIWHLNGPLNEQAKLGAKLILNINSSPYYAGKSKERQAIISKQAKANKVEIAYANMVGGQDELVFDGQSMFMDKKGKLTKKALAFQEELLIEDIKILPARHKALKNTVIISNRFEQSSKKPLAKHAFKNIGALEEVYQALILGLKDYVNKNGFKKVVIGLSGGIDSAIVAVLAVDALGKENVRGIFMPSRYSSKESESDARVLAQNLGIEFLNISIEEIYKLYLEVLKSSFASAQSNIAEENLQARIRGNIVMALSNKFGWLVLTTGNKSEMSTGYATLYGDMAGGFAVIKDVPKTLVYQLAKYRNSIKAVIPQRTITKEPTAELKANQKDSDILPVYEVLDPILKAYVEDDKDLNKIVSFGFDLEIVRKISRMVDSSEYKRRQSPPGIKITPKAFGRDRRMPITNKYRG